MIRLALTLYSLIASTLASTAVIAALVAGISGLWPLVGAAVLGALVAVPVAYFVAKALYNS